MDAAATLPVEISEWKPAPFALGGETVFAVGADTIERIAAPRYYGGVTGRDAALAELRDLGVGFCVFGRLLEGRFQVLDDLQLPALLRSLCMGVSETEFNEPVSSTALREQS